ncbi:hypothetical protein LUZ60_000439 [Juncus effusus]|nr:hypothetical protein LUZ60_000439 [Juncus effusus]
MAYLNSKALLLFSFSSTPRTKFSKIHHANLHVSPNPNNSSIHFSPTAKRTNIQNRVQARVEPKPKSHCTGHLLIIADTAADRAEMHTIIGQQRNNWNHLLLNSINSMNLFASLMAGLSSLSTPQNASIQLAFKISSTLLFSFATLMMIIVNWIQPSQLAEEQRNATRLFKQLEKTVRACISAGSAEMSDVNEMMERVLALDHAYPLSLLPGMLDKFPKKVRPTKWWPQFDLEHKRQTAKIDSKTNGWNKELEEEMKNILKTLKRKDEEQYLLCGELALKINRVLAITGPLFAVLAAIGSSLIGFSNFGHLPIILSLICGSFAVIVNSLEHGGQIGMVFELYRNCAGFYKELEDEIKANMRERNFEKRESGELFETKMALRLGRSTADLKNFGLNGDENEFAGKIF